LSMGRLRVCTYSFVVIGPREELRKGWELKLVSRNFRKSLFVGRPVEYLNPYRLILIGAYDVPRYWPYCEWLDCGENWAPKTAPSNILTSLRLLYTHWTLTECIGCSAAPTVSMVVSCIVPVTQPPSIRRLITLSQGLKAIWLEIIEET